MGMYLYCHVEVKLDGKWTNTNGWKSWSDKGTEDFAYDGNFKNYHLTGYLCDCRTPAEVTPHPNANNGWPSDISPVNAQFDRQELSGTGWGTGGNYYGGSHYTLAELLDTEKTTWLNVFSELDVAVPDEVLYLIFGSENMLKLYALMQRYNLENDDVRFLFYCG